MGAIPERKALEKTLRESKRTQDQHKKKKTDLLKDKQNKEMRSKGHKEGTTYSASAFNELTLTTEPAKKKEKKNRNRVLYLENDLLIL